MEAIVTVDKFGRVLIPKKIREAVGVEPGIELEFIIDGPGNSFTLVPVRKTKPTIKTDKLGIPSISFGLDQPLTFDVVTDIKAGRDERDQKLVGDD